VYLVQVSLLLIGQQGLGHFLRHRPLLPIGWRIVQILRLRQRKTTNAAPTTLNAIQAASHSNFINTQLYPTVGPTQYSPQKKYTKERKPFVFGISHKNLLLKKSYTLKELCAMKIIPENAKYIFIFVPKLPNHSGFV
jgi:hypothetical protein